MRYGAGRDQRGVVLMLTFGTGIGSALFIDGVLVPNTEFGHIEVDGEDGEKRASAAAREREDLSYAKWAKRVDRYLDVLEAGVWPDLIIVGGGVSKKAEKWVPLLTTRTPVVPGRTAERRRHRRRRAGRRRASRSVIRPAIGPVGCDAPNHRVGGIDSERVVTMEKPRPAAHQPGGIPRPRSGQTGPRPLGVPPAPDAGRGRCPRTTRSRGERTQHGKEP